MNLDDAPDLLTADEARQVLRIGRNQFYAAVERGDVPAIRLGRSIRIPKLALQRLITADEVTT